MLFRKGISTFERCSVCNLRFERDHGDTWVFTIITDRIPILLGIAGSFIGLVLGGYLAQAFRARLVLTARRGMPDRAEWASLLAAQNSSSDATGAHDSERRDEATAKRIRGYAGHDRVLGDLIDELATEQVTFAAPVAEPRLKEAHFASANALRSRDAMGRSVKRG
jgi:hypothetical protein